MHMIFRKGVDNNRLAYNVYKHSDINTATINTSLRIQRAVLLNRFQAIAVTCKHILCKSLGIPLYPWDCALIACIIGLEVSCVSENASALSRTLNPFIESLEDRFGERVSPLSDFWYDRYDRFIPLKINLKVKN